LFPYGVFIVPVDLVDTDGLLKIGVVDVPFCGNDDPELSCDSDVVNFTFNEFLCISIILDIFKASTLNLTIELVGRPVRFNPASFFLILRHTAKDVLPVSDSILVGCVRVIRVFEFYNMDVRVPVDAIFSVRDINKGVPVVPQGVLRNSGS
jgi:hypothetical protein